MEKVKGEQEKQTKLLKRKRFAALEKTHRGAGHAGAGPRVGMAVNQSSQSVGTFLSLSGHSFLVLYSSPWLNVHL